MLFVTPGHPAIFRQRMVLALVWFTVFVGGCALFQPALNAPEGRGYAAADPLFHRDPRWLGADAALSIPLAEDRILWLFGDTFIAVSTTQARTESVMVKNTVAVQQGKDPRTAAITFHWGRKSDGSPAAFFQGQGDRWFWPGHGTRLEAGPLVVFLFAMVSEPGPGLGFATAGYALAMIENPDAPPDLWDLVISEVHPGVFDAVPATAVVQDQTHITAVAIRQHGTHAGFLVRYSKADLARGDVSRAEWWAGEKRGWVAQASLAEAGPSFVLDDAGAECSLHWDERGGSFIHIASYGFGASTIGLRRAPALTGPWSPPVMIYRPPEADGPRPLVYAAKAHPELAGPTPADLLITYATNSFEFADLFTPEGASVLYWPRFVLVPIGNRPGPRWWASGGQRP